MASKQQNRFMNRQHAKQGEHLPKHHISGMQATQAGELVRSSRRTSLHYVKIDDAQMEIQWDQNEKREVQKLEILGQRVLRSASELIDPAQVDWPTVD